jgi:hypothetical protein
MRVSEQLSNKHTIAIVGLSGVGKTTLARQLPKDSWFHYSVDYRIWTHYLGDELNDYLKSLAMSHPVLAEMLKRDAITVEHRVGFDNLLATSLFMGMLGDPAKHGSSEEDFRARMQKHATAEIAAMRDIPAFMKRSEDLYGYPNFLIDASGSLCEVVDLEDDNDPVLKLLEDTCVMVYARATESHKRELLRRAAEDPKPIYYRPDFLDENIPALLEHFGAQKVTDISPSDVGSFLYPRLLDHRIQRYEAMAARQGYVLEMDDVFGIKSQDDLLAALKKAETR